MCKVNVILILIVLVRNLCIGLVYADATGTSPINYLPDLPEEHLKRYLNAFPRIQKQCRNCNLPEDISTSSSSSACWGFEQDCPVESRFKIEPNCPQDQIWAHTKPEEGDAFFFQADFGYVKQQREMTVMCQPKFIKDSSLECSKYLRFCRGRNLLIDFRDLVKRKELIRYHMDVLKPGQILGHCDLNHTRLKTEMDHMGALQSWSPELRNFERIPRSILDSDDCDLFVETPTFLMKIDATFNMYHHFCDFFNLYASLFVNQSHPLAFSRDVQILIWETYPYESPFAVTFKAFSRHPVWTLNDVKGKRVCFRNLVFPLLPRMIFGLFYNTPLVNGCGSGLFRAFSEFILHRLEIPFQQPLEENRIRVTFLSRQTKYRQVLNEDELLEEIRKDNSLEVRKVSFERVHNFTEQLKITRNTDILVGIHGAGLTHLLFLPNWATIFELYNCEDPNCYKDLSRLRGVHYITWERQDLVYPEDEGHHPQQGGAHAKFTNYKFDPKEFSRLVRRAADNVRNHSEYRNYQKENIISQRDEF